MTIRVITDNTCSGFSAPWLLSVRLPIGMGAFHSSLLLHLTGAVKLSRSRSWWHIHCQPALSMLLN